MAQTRGMREEGYETFRTPVRTLQLGALNVHACSTIVSKRDETERMCVESKMEVLALTMTKLKWRGEREFGCVSGSVRGGLANKPRSVLECSGVERGVTEVDLS